MEIKEKQRKLQTLGFYHRQIDGVEGPHTKEAMREFEQQSGGMDLDSDVDVGVDDRYWPNADSVQRSRPYYMLTVLPRPEPGRHEAAKLASNPIGIGKSRAELAEKAIVMAAQARERCRQQRDTIIEALEKKQPTDIFVLSHGWHRNFFVAISAYDRLVSRFIGLLRRDRLNAPKGFKPFFICLHWHSDPGEDSMVDPSGRRDKDAFIAAALTAFDPVGSEHHSTMESAQAGLLNLLEDLYEIFTYTGSPGLSKLPPNLKKKADELAVKMPSVCRLRDTLTAAEPGDVLPELICMAWRCYDESKAARVLMDQSEQPGAFMQPAQAISALINFAIGTAGLVAIISSFNGKFQAAGAMIAKAWAGSVGSAINSICGPLLALSVVVQFAIFSIASAAIGWLILKAVIAWRYDEREDEGAKSLPIAAVAGWTLLQIPALFPLLIYSLLTYVFEPFWLPLIALALPDIGPYHLIYAGWIIISLIIATAIGNKRTAVGLFNERTANGSVPGSAMATIRAALAKLANDPGDMLTHAVAKDSSVRGWAAALQAQLAFYTMQVRGVEAGWDAGKDLAGILKTIEAGRPGRARIHLIGHSFGGLVISNIVDYFKRNTQVRIESQVLVEAAIASTWYSGASGMVDGDDPEITGLLACIYSSYDTANGFYYPLSNKGRMAAGSVGLFSVGAAGRKPDVLGKGGIFASLVHPPLIEPLTGVKPFIVNLDASRIIFEGPVAAGGGHDDVFKDDVVYLVWALCSSIHKEHEVEVV